MKAFNILVVFLLLLGTATAQEAEPNKGMDVNTAKGYASFGQKITDSGTMSSQEMAEKFNAIAVADTVETKFKAKVVEVCQAKGCWMKLTLEDGHETMVRFKDYGFFMPKDITGKEVVVRGKAFVEAMSVEDQKHYAKDAGMSEQEIAKITAPKKPMGLRPMAYF
ncbi:DUF4920 domain-containing protein [Maribacter halichondriae]|uniref:DUF4920 domain-containing protein n=1 Tax=Maribacter halichondriae TaxID=2980554 RepID=UPI0030760F22